MMGLLILLGAATLVLLCGLAAMLAFEMRHPPRHTMAYALARGMPCDPGEVGLDFDQWWLDRPDGASLPVWDIRTNRDSERDDSLTIVFVHGWGHSRINVLPRVRLFVEGCKRLVLYDLRGHGESRNCASRLGDGEQRDLLALLERVGKGPVVLVGHSMGAVIAIQAAIEAAHGAMQALPHIAGIISYSAYCDFHVSLRGRLTVAGYPTRPITDLALLVNRASGVHPLTLRPADVASIDCPMLMFHGEDDRVAPSVHSQRLATSAKDAEFHCFAGAAHADVHAVDPDHHDAIVRDFIARLKPIDEAGSEMSSPRTRDSTAAPRANVLSDSEQ